MDMTKMGAFLQELRKEHGMTQEQLGGRLHVSAKTISRWETGAYMPPVEMLLELSALYGLSINELVSGELLSPESLPQAAEENLAAALKEREVFRLEERKAFWSKKWNRDHRSTMILLALLLLAGYIAGTVFSLDWLSLATVAAAVCASLYLHNRRAGYIEHHLYDDKLDK